MKHLKFFFLLFIPFLFSSCIDYVQAIGYKDGEYHFYYKVAISKEMCELIGEDAEALFGSINFAVFDEEKKGMKGKKIDTEHESGIEFSFSYNPEALSDPFTVEDLMMFLPIKKGNKTTIPFLLGASDDYSSVMDDKDADVQQAMETMFSSTKCRILISKNFLSNVTDAYFESKGRGSKIYSIDVYDYGESYCLEIPFSVLLKDNEYNIKQIIVLSE
ncbi:hypothetical protein [Treponema sp.]|uniref:hypothetical protein n=1 Tax=Treponema sp. TaxID=166 RepID=UPI00298D7DD6|nr:hypothetical protein [Treponema sp.]MCR5613364.1 hypothetical protein [Treponema sp.]